MLNLKDIRFLTPEERAEAAARRRDEETQVYQQRLASLDEWPLDRPCGRSRLVLPPEVAQRVLDDVAAGASLRATAVSASVIDVSWNVANNADGYVVQWRGPTNSWGDHEAAVSGADTTSYSITGL